MITYEIISFRQKGVTSGNNHFEKHRFDRKKRAMEVLQSADYPKFWYTLTKLLVDKGKVINSELISCR